MYVHGGGGGLLVDEGQWSKRMYNRGNTEVHAPMVVPDAFSTLCVLCVARTTLPATTQQRPQYSCFPGLEKGSTIINKAV